MRALLGATGLAAASFGAPAGAVGAALVPLAPAGSPSWTLAPIHAASPPRDPRLFVVERSGAVRIVQDGVLRAKPFIFVPGVDTTGERGLLSIAFPADYAATGRFYLFASAAGSPAETRVLKYRVSQSDPNVADPSSARVVLRQPLSSATNHNGGQLAFGPDGRLYVTLGDNAQRDEAPRLESQLGKVLRIDPADPDGVGPLTYTVPADNPFAGSPVWASGLRNPYRASFDPAGRLIIADVGESTVEEIDIGEPGADFGWPRCEGPCSAAGVAKPFHTYQHTVANQNCSVIGGLVVRDPRLSALVGRYLFGDYCSGDARSIDLGPAGPDARAETISGARIGSLWGFAEDARGCAYVLGNGTISRIAAAAGDPKACGLPYLGDPPDAADPGAATPMPPAPTPTPGPDPTPTPTPEAGSPPGAAVVVDAGLRAKMLTEIVRAPKNCVSAGIMSIRSDEGRISAVRVVKGKTRTPLSFVRKGTRVELHGLPTGRVTLRLTVRTTHGGIVHLTRRYRPCD